MHWTFVGAGNMASSLVGGLLAGGGHADEVTLVDPHEDTRARAEARFGVTAVAQLDAAAAPPEGLARGFVVAVKPDVVERACRAIAAVSDPDEPPLVVSVAAGVRHDALAHWLAPRTPIVRCMPNTPALLGLGAIGIHADSRCTAAQVAHAEALLGATGMTVRVDEERLLDAVTATSGSGPAYFFYLIEQMGAAGAALGLDPDVARELAIETAFGAASMARAREVEPGELRRRVTSKGGTTAAALAAFDAAGLPDIVRRAMRAAHERAVELGDEHSPHGGRQASPSERGGGRATATGDDPSASNDR